MEEAIAQPILEEVVVDPEDQAFLGEEGVVLLVAIQEAGEGDLC